MGRLSPIVLICVCLVCVTLGAMLAGDAIVGLAPDHTKQVFAARKALCENLAVQYSLLATGGHDDTIRTAMRALIERQSDIQSAALDKADGARVAQAGDHSRFWIQPPGQQSTVNHIQVPIYKSSTPWGTLQLSFKPLYPFWGEQLLMGAWPRFLAFVSVLCFLGYFTFMKRTLRHLDPSQVIPPRVKAALDSLTDGVVMLDPAGSIVLANDTFCRLVQRSLNDILGTSLSGFAWTLDPHIPPMASFKFPWDQAIDQKVPQQEFRLGFRSDEERTRTLSVTSTPILDEQSKLRGVLASFHDVTDIDRANLQLRDAIAQLEQSRTQVLSQNDKLERTNETLQHEIEERKRVQAEREELNKQLLESSRLVGMADVASSVLHNVGNVLNSVNVSVDVVTKTLKQAPIGDVALVATMLQAHSHELGQYLADDPQGKQIPSFLSMLAEAVSHNQATVEKELGNLSRNIDHIRQVVSRQMDLARPGGTIQEPVHFQELMEQALAIYRPALDSRGCEIVKQYDEVPDGLCDRHQVLQILVNLVSNAKNAIDGRPGQPHRLSLRCSLAEDLPGFVRFQVADSGVGIAAEYLPRLFTQGFTTRPNGHGIGLHSAALAARNLGGTLHGHSEGVGRGATFTFDLPLIHDKVSA